MNKTANDVINSIIGIEGGYTNNPADPGGATRWGVTERVARDNGYTGDMASLPRDTAFSILMQSYYTGPRFDAIEALLPGVGAKMADCGVNMGVSVPSKFLQRLLNALNQRGKSYSDVVVDGRIGLASISAVKALRAVRGAEDATSVLLKGINGLQCAEYIRQAEAVQSKEDFLFGWIKNRID